MDLGYESSRTTSHHKVANIVWTEWSLIKNVIVTTTKAITPPHHTMPYHYYCDLD